MMLTSIPSPKFVCFFKKFPHTSKVTWCKRCFMLITEHVALKVGQEEGDLYPQSQLEPWSQIKRRLVADGGNMASARQL